MAFEVEVSFHVPTTNQSREQARKVCALMDVPEEVALLPSIDIQRFRSGGGLVTVQIAKQLTVEQLDELHEILGMPT